MRNDKKKIIYIIFILRTVYACFWMTVPWKKSMKVENIKLSLYLHRDVVNAFLR